MMERNHIPKTISLLIFSILGLSGVSSCQHYKPQNLESDSVASAFQFQSLNDPRVNDALDRKGLRNSVSNATAWKLFELQIAAEVLHPALERARVENAVSQTAIGVANALPPLSVSLDLQRASGVASPWTYGVIVDRLLDWGTRRKSRIEIAEIETERSLIVFAAQTWEIRAALTAAFVEWNALESRVKLQSQLQLSLSNWKETTERMLTLGEGNRMQIVTIEHELKQLELDKSKTKKRSSIAHANLARAIGLPEHALRDTVFESFEVGLPDLPQRATLENMALLRRPDVLSSFLDYAVSESNLRQEYSRQYPDLHLGPGYSYDQGQHKWIFGVGLSIPMNGNRASILKAKADRELAAARFSEHQSAVIGDISMAIAEYAGCVDQWHRSQVIKSNSEEQLFSQIQLLEAGIADRSQVIQTTIQWQREQLLSADLKTSAWSAYLKLQNAVGTQLPPFDATQQ